MGALAKLFKQVRDFQSEEPVTVAVIDVAPRLPEDAKKEKAAFAQALDLRTTESRAARH